MDDAHFILGRWAHDANIVGEMYSVVMQNITKSGHKFAHAMTIGLSCLVQNFDKIGSL